MVTVLRSLVLDSVSPAALYEKLTDSRPGTFLLESADQDGIWSRYSFIGLSAWGALSEAEGRAVWLDYGLSESTAFDGECPPEATSALRRLYKKWNSPAAKEVPPLTSGLVGFIGWEAVHELENFASSGTNEQDCPNQTMLFVRDLLVIDHSTSLVQLVTTVLADSVDDEAAWDAVQARLTDLESQLNTEIAIRPGRIPNDPKIEVKHRTSKADFLASIETAKRHISDGDIFQVVLSQRFDAELSAKPISLYRVLRTLNPSPYMYLLSLEDSVGEPFSIVGSSPEALVKITSNRVVTHPIAGSRPRGKTPDEDSRFAESLLADEKEKAEHLMLVDLARNDIAKVCAAGSVEVTEFMNVERFSHIMHLVSSVEGELRADLDPIAVFEATFPAGTLSGAPKPKALEIIDRLEPASRGAYGGVVGYFGFAGDADLAITIRTAIIRNGRVSVQAGAGIVADSDPESEYRETETKAGAVLTAIANTNWAANN